MENKKMKWGIEGFKRISDKDKRVATEWIWIQDLPKSLSGLVKPGQRIIDERGIVYFIKKQPTKINKEDIINKINKHNKILLKLSLRNKGLVNLWETIKQKLENNQKLKKWEQLKIDGTQLDYFTKGV